MHGIGNDFIVIDARSVDADWMLLAKEMCDRHFGIGADGLILVCPAVESGDLRMRMLNPDGSESEMCGNGIRCFAKYVLDNKIDGLEGPELSVETLAGTLKVEAVRQGELVTHVTVSMGVPILKPSQIPVAVQALGLSEDAAGPVLKRKISTDVTDLELTFVSMGNPHAVSFIDDPVAQFPLEIVGPKVEHHSLFPRRINFEIVNTQSRNRLEVRVWERGAGITLACGTGACAVAVAARLNGLIDDNVEIRLPGGALHIQWDGKGEVIMTGPAELVFDGEWSK